MKERKVDDCKCLASGFLSGSKDTGGAPKVKQ